jgi:transposase-like protein
MACIVAGIISLLQHKNSIQEKPEIYNIENCPFCSKAALWRHGYRFRKPDRENDEKSTLNPIPILRMYCSSCRRTCSVLPECIPPRRWYLWLVQQTALLFHLAGISLNKISQEIKPSHWTVSRWVNRLKDQFQDHVITLRSKWSCLGYHTGFNDFWAAALNKIELSQAMLFLNDQGISVP